MSITDTADGLNFNGRVAGYARWDDNLRVSLDWHRFGVRHFSRREKVRTAGSNPFMYTPALRCGSPDRVGTSPFHY